MVKGQAEGEDVAGAVGRSRLGGREQAWREVRLGLREGLDEEWVAGGAGLAQVFEGQIAD